MEGELGAVPAMAFASWWYATVNTRGVMFAAGFGDPVFDVVPRECRSLILSDGNPCLAEGVPVGFYTRDELAKQKVYALVVCTE